MKNVFDAAAQKRQLINQWEASAIGLQEAEERGLIRYSSMTPWRNWTSREALYEFAQQSAQAKPVLVRVDTKRMALFTPQRGKADAA